MTETPQKTSKDRENNNEEKEEEIIDSKQTDQRDGGDQNSIIVESRQWRGWGKEGLSSDQVGQIG